MRESSPPERSDRYSFTPYSRSFSKQRRTARRKPPSTPEAIRVFQENRLLYAPGKAANAGGVATSGLEMTQNSMRLQWTPEEVDERLHAIMRNIHEVCVRYGTQPDGYVNYVVGANIGGFMKVANAMLAQGCV